MKAIRTALCSVLASLWLALPAFAEESAPAAVSKWEQLKGLGRAALYFLLVMAAIGFCLFLTRKIGEKWGKH